MFAAQSMIYHLVICRFVFKVENNYNKKAKLEPAFGLNYLN